jgi:hypothetical protein
MKLYALMFYGVDEADCYGVTDSIGVAKRWEQACDYHSYIELDMNDINFPNWVSEDERAKILGNG